MQHSLDFPVQFSKEAYSYGSRSDGGIHGVVLTKPHIAELVLDLAGYTSDLDLSRNSLLEPSCGHGAFLVPAAMRLLESARRHGRDLTELEDAIVGFDIDNSHVEQTRRTLVEALVAKSVANDLALRLAARWVQSADFLLAPLAETFDFVVGNPPYVRIEQVSTDLQEEYRRRYATIFDRADLYVAFIERGLHLLSPKGVLSFICADRWTLNRYGTPLRKLVTSAYHVRTYVDLHKASPFETDVIAYPSIFVIAREAIRKPTNVVTLTQATPEECAVVRQRHSASVVNGNGGSGVDYTEWFKGGDPWVLSSPRQLSTLRELENRLPLIEESGGNTSVKIGVATGNDSLYIVPSDADIEPDRLLPLVMRNDIKAGAIQSARRSVINTFDTNGVIELGRYPRLHRYLETHADVIKRRHVAQKSANVWFRTIDRVYPALVSRPKLLIPDIAGANEIAYDPGGYYPHHNLYFVISDAWEMEVLGGLLSSRVALFFVWSYAVKMRGGYLRFQAQYLRRIRVPSPTSISDTLKNRLRNAFRQREFAKLDDLACEVYGLSDLPEFDFVDTRS